MHRKHESIPIRSFEELSLVKKYHDNEKDENFIIDYDEINYVRIMKLFKPSINSAQYESFKKSISLNDYTHKHSSSKNGNGPSDEIVEGQKLIDEIFNPFHIRFYLPKTNILRRGEKIKKLVIMFNGMDEKDDFLLYDTLGEYFVAHEIAAVLIPTQLHLNRKIWSKENDIAFTPTRIAINNIDDKNKASSNNSNALLFYHHFIKSWFELQELVGKVTNEDDYWGKRDSEESALRKLTRGKPHDNVNEKDYFMYLADKEFYRTYFGIKEALPRMDLEITLLGYSLGGLRSLAFFLNDHAAGEKHLSKYHSCITINTCPDLRDAHTDLLGISKDTWITTLMKKVEASVISQEESNDELEELRKMFLNLYFPAKIQEQEEKYLEEIEFEEFQKKLAININKYLAISSGADDVVDVTQMDKIAPRNISIHKITVAGVNHMPFKDPNWQDLLPRIESNMVEFIETCNERHHTKNEIIAKLVVVLIRLKRFKEICAEFLKEYDELNATSSNPSEKPRPMHGILNFNNDDLAKIISSIDDSKLQTYFLRYFYLSKSFYPHFAQLIDRVNNEIITPIGSGKTDKKNQLSSSEIIFEIIKLYHKYDSKEGRDINFQSKVKKCTEIITRLHDERETCKSEMEELKFIKSKIDALQRQVNKNSIKLERLNKMNVQISDLIGKKEVLEKKLKLLPYFRLHQKLEKINIYMDVFLNDKKYKNKISSQSR